MLLLSITSSVSARAVPRRLILEVLENRELFSISPDEVPAYGSLTFDTPEEFLPAGFDAVSFASGASGSASAADATKNPLSALPALNSLPGARVSLFLDFNGATTSGWESTPVTTPVYDFDGDRTTFSNAELTSIREIWARVSEDYAPFNINVTTVDPGNLTDGLTAKIAIGGNYSDWFGQGAGGVAYVGGFSNAASNVGFVFPDALGNGTARYVAEAASHEAGHLFGLWHQSTYNTSGQKTAEYSSGNANWAPIMGVGYYSAVTTWYNGPNSNGPSSLQDDMSILSGTSNGFGYRTDDAGDTTSTAAALTISGTTITGSGVISRNTDADYYKFSTSGGAVNVSVAGIQVGGDFDAVLELRNSSGSLIVSASSTTSLGASLSANLAAGDYFVVVHSTGVYGYVGQYVLSGTVPAGSTSNNGGSNNNGGGGTTSTAPEITVLYNGTSIADNAGSFNFGTVRAGSSVTRTFTVRNDGNAPLMLTQLSSTVLPRGFTLAAGFGQLTLQAGQSTYFAIRFGGSTRGSYGGNFAFNNNDADEGTFNFRVYGVVNTTGIPGARGEIFGGDPASTEIARGVSLLQASAMPGVTGLLPSEGVSSAGASAALEVGDNAASASPLAAPAFGQVQEADRSQAAELEQRVDDQFAAIDALITAALSDEV